MAVRAPNGPYKIQKTPPERFLRRLLSPPAPEIVPRWPGPPVNPASPLREPPGRGLSRGSCRRSRRRPLRTGGAESFRGCALRGNAWTCRGARDCNLNTGSDRGDRDSIYQNLEPVRADPSVRGSLRHSLCQIRVRASGNK